MKNLFLKFSVICFFSLTFSGCAVYERRIYASSHGGPPDHAPALGYREKAYRYVYYPHEEVYYSAVRHKYYWNIGGHWHFGPRLPVSIVIGSSPSVYVDLYGAQPYLYHRTVIHKYPRHYRGHSYHNRGHYNPRHGSKPLYENRIQHNDRHYRGDNRGRGRNNQGNNSRGRHGRHKH